MISYLIYLIILALFIATCKCCVKYRKQKKLADLWTKVYKSYLKDDFGTINKTVKVIKKMGDDDHVFKLIEVENLFYGKTVFQDKKKALDILLEINKIPLPPKSKWETNKYTKDMKLVKNNKKNKLRAKKEGYIKKIKGRARKIWNDNRLWTLHHNIYQEVTTTEKIWEEYD